MMIELDCAAADVALTGHAFFCARPAVIMAKRGARQLRLLAGQDLHHARPFPPVVR